MLKFLRTNVSEVTELTLIPKDSTGRVTCFVIFEEVNILDRIDSSEMPISFKGEIHILLFSQALSQRQLSLRRKKNRSTQSRGRGRRYRGHQSRGNYYQLNVNSEQSRQTRNLDANDTVRRRQTIDDLEGWIRYNVMVPEGTQLGNLRIFSGENLFNFSKFLKYYERSENQKLLSVKTRAQNIEEKNDVEIHSIQEFGEGHQNPLIRDLSFELNDERRETSNQVWNEEVEHNFYKSRSMNDQRGIRNFKHNVSNSLVFSRGKGPGNFEEF